LTQIYARPMARLTGALLFALGSIAITGRALANGAFPDSQSILLPADRPNQIVLATNFGLITSDDDAQTWTWSCEQPASANARLYQVGPAPLDRLFAISTVGLAYSDDGACGWKVEGGAASGETVADAFPDAANPQRVLAIFVPASTATAAYTVYESSDGGATFSTLRFTATLGDMLTGVEIARSDPSVIYLTVAGGTAAALTPKLVKSTNGGVDWQTTDLTAALGPHNIRLISVDPQDPGKLFLRVTPGNGDMLAVTADSGATFTTPLTVPGGILTSFARMPSGTILLAGVAGTQSVIFRSTDGGMNYAQLDSPSLRGLAERGGRLFGATDDVADGYALGESTDEGQSWQPRMRYDQIQAISACLKTTCQADCQNKADQDLWSPDICGADPMPAPLPDAGTAADGAVDAAPAPATSGQGCHCRVAAGETGRPEGALFFTALGLLFTVTRRRRRAVRPGSGRCWRSPGDTSAPNP
jgi:MYXO-CTERM domain-containing protein